MALPDRSGGVAAKSDSDTDLDSNAVLCLYPASNFNTDYNILPNSYTSSFNDPYSYMLLLPYVLGRLFGHPFESDFCG